MTEPGTIDPNNIKFQPLGPPEGLLEQFNLPPKVIAFMRRYQRILWGVVIAVVVLSLSIAGVNAYRDHRERLAASALDAALIAKQDRKALLEKMVAKFGSTDSALWAKLELASLEERAGQAAKAIEQLEGIKAGLPAKSLVRPLLIGKLAALYENEHQLDKAVGLYTELTGWESFAAGAYRALGRVNEQLGRREEAIAMYGKYLEAETAPSFQGGADPVREMVQSRLNQLKK